MRLTAKGPTARMALLALITFTVSVYRLAVWQTALLLAGWFFLAAWMARSSLPPAMTMRMLSPAKKPVAGPTAKPRGHRGRVRFRLESMPVSHFVESVRWALDLAGVDYEEETNSGILGLLMNGWSVPRLHDAYTGSVLGESGAIMDHVAAQCAHEHPVLLSLVHHAHRDEARSWDLKISLFGHAIQHFGYAHLLAGDANPIFCLTSWGAFEPHVPLAQRLVVRALFPAIKRFMNQALKLQHKPAVDASYATLLATFDAVDAAIAKHDCLAGDASAPPPRYLLGTATPTYIDLKFASLCAILLLRHLIVDADQVYYTRGRFQSFARLREMTFPKAISDIEDLAMSRPCGQFAVRMYKTLRDAKKV